MTRFKDLPVFWTVCWFGAVLAFLCGGVAGLTAGVVFESGMRVVVLGFESAIGGAVAWVTVIASLYLAVAGDESETAKKGERAIRVKKQKRVKSWYHTLAGWFEFFGIFALLSFACGFVAGTTGGIVFGQGLRIAFFMGLESAIGGAIAIIIALLLLAPFLGFDFPDDEDDDD